MGNPFDQFDSGGGNPFDQFDSVGQTVKPRPMGKDAQADFLKQALAEADWGTRNIAGAGTALSNLWEGAKQLVGKGDADQIAANKIIEQAAPVGSIAGNVALAAIPFGLAGSSVKAATGVGLGMGALKPVEGDQSFENVARGKTKSALVDAALAGLGQAGANKVGELVADKLAALQTLKAQNATRDELLQRARELGLVVPRSSVDPSAGNVLVDSVAGKIATAQDASSRNAKVFQDVARKELGLSPDASMSPELLSSIRSNAYKTGYEPLNNAGRIATDTEYGAALDKIISGRVQAGQDFPVSSDPVLDLINGTKATTREVSPATTGFFDKYGRAVDAADASAPVAPKLRSLLAELKKAGGINPNELGDLGEQFVNKNYPGLLNKRTGKSADGFTEWMVSNGWIPENVAREADQMPGGTHELARDMIRSALGRESVVHPAQYDKWSAYNQAAEDFYNAGINQVNIPAKTASGLRVPDFDAASGMAKIQMLRQEAGEAFRKGDNAIGFAKKQAADALEEQIGRGIASGGDGAAADEMLQNFRNARQQIAKAHTVEDAMNAGSGAFDPRKVPERDLGKLTGDMKTIVEFARAFPKASQSEAQIAGPGVNNLGMLLKAGLSTVIGSGPGIVAPFVAPYLARQYTLSSGAQNALLQNLYQLGLPARVANGLLTYAPVGPAVLGAQSLLQ